VGITLAEQFLGVGQRPTAIVARERRITGRQVERRVRKLTRTSPNQLACLFRFQKVRDAIWADPTIDLAGLAIDAGYSDQPHMTRHFRRYSGQTPAQFARSSMAKK
jgi:transcriptional regulator GlxA family with amidase domain